MKWRCNKCTMTFRVGLPASIRAEWSRCSCGLLHWSAGTDCESNCYGAPPKVIVCGVDAVPEKELA